MSSLFKTAAMVIKTKLSSLGAKIKQWTEPEFIKSVLLAKLQEFFQSLFDVKPKDRNDYYVFFSWMISKKLAFSLVVLLGLGSLFLITMFHPFEGIGQGRGAVKTYRYDSLPLKFHKGEVKILAEDGHIAYVGAVEKGNAAGAGKLYGRNGELIYEGAFENSMFNGEGKLYYGGGALKYSGGFLDNLYQGTGNGFWNNGLKEYSGGYEQGKKSGEGQLYDSGGNLILTGAFSADLPVYAQFLGKSTEEAGQIYTGKIAVYDSGEEFCVEMPQIQAIYTARAGDDSLEDVYKVERVYVLADRITMAGEVYDEISDLRDVMGEAVYQGYSNMVLAEAVGIEALRKRGNLDFADPQIEGNRTFEEVMEVTGYRKNYDLYLYAFTYEDLVYSFYSDKKTGRFAMYSIEHAG